MSIRGRLVGAARRRLSPATKRRIRRVQRRLLGRGTRDGLQVQLDRANAAFSAGDYEDAAQAVQAALERKPADGAALDLASRIAVKRGAFSEAARYAVTRAVYGKKPAHWLRARKIVGRLRETDIRWQPTVSAPRPRPPEASRTVYLAKESRPFLHNGFCTRTHESLQSLARAGRDVIGVTMPGFPGVLGVEDPPAESVVEDVVYRHLLPRAGKALSALAFDEYTDITTQVLAGFVARERPALLHVGSGHRGFETALAGNAVARWAGIPWLYEVRSFFETTWSGDAKYMEQGEYYQRRFDTENRMMHAADLVITLSGPMRDEIAHRHGVPEEKIRVVPNAVDLSRFTPMARDPRLREKLGLAGTFTLGYVSNLSHRREGQEVLVEAVARLRRRGHSVTCLLVGDGKRRSELEQLARQLGVAREVVFAGNVPFDEVADYYAQIDLFVIPRIDERAARMVSPMKPFEAMAMRIPIVVSDLPALVEIAGDDERAHRFRAGDADSLAHAAALLMDAPAERNRLVETSASWVRRERSWSVVAARFGDAYDELLARPAAR